MDHGQVEVDKGQEKVGQAQKVVRQTQQPQEQVTGQKSLQDMTVEEFLGKDPINPFYCEVSVKL